MSSLRAVRSADAESRPPLEQPPAEPTILELACSCGAVVRTHRPVAGMSCPVCGLGLAMPPAPATMHSKAPSATTSVMAGAPAERAPPVTSHHKDRLEERATRRLPPARLGWAPSWRRTVLLLIVACTVVIGLTLRFEWRRRAAIQIGDHLAAGRHALSAGNFEEAATSLSLAARAARTLDGNSPQAALALALDREAQVWNRLSPRTIDDFFTEHGPSGGADPEHTFDREFAGRALVFDGFVEPVVARANYGGDEPFDPRRPMPVGGVDPGGLPPDPPARPDDNAHLNQLRDKANSASAAKANAAVVANPWQLDWQLAGPRYVVELASDELDLFEGLPRTVATRVIFGGVIDRLELLPGTAGRWRLHLVPESCVLLTAAGPLEQQQWPDEAGWRPVLAAQARSRDVPQAGSAAGAKP